MSRSIFISGVSSGIGRALAAEYLRRGAEVYGVSRRTPQDLIAHSGFHFVSVDLTDEAAVKTKLAALLNEVPSLHTVILNAGKLGRIADLQEVPQSELSELMAVNVWAQKLTLDVVLNGCQRIHNVVAISSGAAVNGNRGWGGYAISKAALNMLIQLYAAENPSIHFTALAPGLVDTAMQDDLCSLPSDSRFPSLEVLKSRRGTADMPTPDQIAPRLIDVFEEMPEMVPSGGFVDIRQLPERPGTEKIELSN